MALCDQSQGVRTGGQTDKIICLGHFTPYQLLIFLKASFTCTVTHLCSTRNQEGCTGNACVQVSPPIPDAHPYNLFNVQHNYRKFETCTYTTHRLFYRLYVLFSASSAQNNVVHMNTINHHACCTTCPVVRCVYILSFELCPHTCKACVYKIVHLYKLCTNIKFLQMLLLFFYFYRFINQ